MSLSASQRARLGLFMTAGIVLIAIFVAIPVGVGLANRPKQFYALFEGESVSGLERGAGIKFRGVPVGTVDKITYDPKNLKQVRVGLRIEHDFPMKQDMYVQIGGFSITGIKHLEISGGSDESPLLVEGSQVESRQSAVAAITGKAEDIVAKIELLLNHVEVLTHPDSALGTILENVAVISKDAKEFVAFARPRLESGTGSFASLIARIDSISKDVQAISSETRKTFSGNRFTSIMESVDSSAMSIRQVSDDVALIIKQSREDIMVSMQNLREAIENANELTKIVAENPSLLLRGEQPREREAR